MPKLSQIHLIDAVITGASSGIGAALARQLAAAGARVHLVARRQDRLASLAAEINDAGGKAHVLPCDVADREQIRAAAAAVLARTGKVDLLINNAGYGRHRDFVAWDYDDMERMMRVNYLGALAWTKELLPQMLERRSGWLVYVASVAGRLGVPAESAYGASKFAMVGLAEALTLELTDKGVHVLTVCPGTVDTEFFDAEARERMPAIARRLMVSPERLASATVQSLQRGRHEVTYPRFIGLAYVARLLAPRFYRWAVRRTAVAPRR